MRWRLALLAFLLVAVGRVFAAEGPGAAGSPQLRMEELEVRGIRERPEVLYLPVHRGVGFSSPARYDLFIEDMGRPVFPREVPPPTRPSGETDEEGASLE